MKSRYAIRHDRWMCKATQFVSCVSVDALHKRILGKSKEFYTRADTRASCHSLAQQSFVSPRRTPSRWHLALVITNLCLLSAIHLSKKRRRMAQRGFRTRNVRRADDLGRQCRSCRVQQSKCQSQSQKSPFPHVNCDEGVQSWRCTRARANNCISNAEKDKLHDTILSSFGCYSAQRWIWIRESSECT